MKNVLQKLSQKELFLISGIIVLVLIDQIVKCTMIQLVGEHPIAVIGDFIQAEISKNTGGAFGIGQNDIGMFIITNFVVLGIIIRFMITQKEQMDKNVRIALSFILAGGFSNLLDRIIRGFVVDFISIGNFPNFNLADCFIVGGWIVFCFFIAKYTWFEYRKKKEKDQK